MPRSRDYKAEYARRMSNAKSRGLSRSQARGHGGHGSSALPPDERARFERALQLYRQNRNQSAAAKAVKLAPERLRRFLRENVQIEGRGRSLKIIDQRRREMIVISGGVMTKRILRDFDQASLNGEYLSAVKSFLVSNEIDDLASFRGRSVIDAKGRPHLLETRSNALYRLVQAGDEVFHEIYRLVL